MQAFISSLRRIITLLGLCALLTTCGTQTGNMNYERAHTPWAVRSVLDLKPRMLTLALNKNLWVAYSTQFGSFYKAWKGNVNFDGSVYNTKHGPQPITVGADYFINKYEEPWIVTKAGKSVKADFRYVSYSFRQGQVTLKYELILSPQEKITIEETPEYTENKEGLPGLERIFKIYSTDTQISVALKTNLANISDEKNLETNGEWKLDKKSSENIANGKSVLNLEGVLTLNPNDKTYLRAYFEPSALKEQKSVESGDLAPEEMIAQSDCHSCHNEEKKTVGPAYISVAQKYDNSPESVEYLANKIIKGGSGVWGETAMNAHPDLDFNAASNIARYILGLDKKETKSEIISSSEDKNTAKGVVVNVYQFAEALEKIPAIPQDKKPVISKIKNNTVVNSSFVNPLTHNYLTVMTGFLKVDRSAQYVFDTRNTDGGSRLTIDGRVLIDFDGYHQGGWIGSEDAEIELKAGMHPFKFEYFRAKANPYENGDHWLGVLRWKPYGVENLDIIPIENLSYEPNALIKETDKMVKPYTGPKIPGDKIPLASVHPSFDLSQARPDDFQPKVAGLDFMSDGRMIISTWDSLGAVYELSNLEQNDPNKIQVRRIAEGLAEPLGLKVIEDEIYVMQKQELTKLIDHNKDGIIDEYMNVCNGWKVSSNFHEFGFGLVYKDGYLYGGLATAINPGGASTKPQISDRGKIIKVNIKDGSFEFIAHGMRTPNGIGIGVDGEIFNSDNQGDWLPASKVVHIQKGAFYGSRSVDFEGTKDLKTTLPVVWMPQDEIGNSPAQPARIDIGPYKNQLLISEVTHGGVKRAFVEKINDQYQGALFRFTQGIEAGVNRLMWSPDGQLYLGCIGVNGNWGHYVDGKMGQFGLQRLKFNEKSTFEMLAVRAKSNGMEIELTEPLQEGDGLTAESYEVKQWWYKPTENYGGPKMDEEELKIISVNLSADRKKVFLELEGMKKEHLIYIRLKDHFISAQNHELWSTECWYTLNNIPKNKPGFKSEAQEKTPDNQLTKAEQKAGFKLLFDGKSTENWHMFNSDKTPTAWKVEDGTLVFDKTAGEGGDLVTNEEFESFELKLDWKISKNGNSGLFFYVIEDKKYKTVYLTGPEMQILDDAGHPDAQIEKHRAGDLYDLIACKYVTVKPAEEWNQARLIVNKGKVEHWLNGRKVVEYEMWTDEWKKLVAGSKFKEMPDFGTARKGRLALQDHGDKVWFKNIKIRVLK